MPRHRTRTQKTIRRIVRHIHTRIKRSRRFRYLRLVILQRLSTVLIAGGLLILFLPILQKSITGPEPSTVNESQAETTSFDFGPIRIEEALTRGTIAVQSPVRIIIPSVAIDLPVIESKLVNGYWEVSETTASHGMGSSLPGQNGNTVIFAHARKGLFLPLRDIAANNRVYVLTNDRWHRYRVVQTTEVAPNNIQTIRPTDDETLTLFTCSGFLDSKRLVVVAKPDR